MSTTSGIPEQYGFNTIEASGTSIRSGTRHVAVDMDIANLEDIDDADIPDYCPDTTSISELIQSATIIRETLRGIGFPEESEFETYSRLRVEQILKSVNFHEATGFSLKIKGWPCCPKFTLTPKSIIDSELFRTSIPWKFKGTSECGCFCCFMPASLSKQTMTLKQNELEVLSFTYQPQLWTACRPTPKKLEIFIPQRTECIGSLMYGKSYGEKTIIVDRISRTVFLTAKMESSYGNILEFPRIMIRDNLGMPLAVAEATAGFRSNGITNWTEFELTFSPLAINESASAKAVMAVAFAMWVITRKEGKCREASKVWLVAVIIAIIIFVFIRSQELFGMSE